LGRDDARRDASAHGRHPRGEAALSRAHDHHHRAPHGRDRAHHRSLRGAQLRAQDRRGRVPGGRGRQAGAGSVPGGGMSAAAALTIENLYTAYDRADVLEDVALAVPRGKITCLLGSNGSGKTTLIRSILGLTPARRGRIVFEGTDITRLPTHRVIAAGL